MKLTQLQETFVSSVINRSHAHELEKSFSHYNSEELQARLNIYRNNFFVSTSELLKETFSAVEAIVGEAFFTALATHFVQAHPPVQADMNALGDTFPSFIAHFEHTQNLPYLADVARLNWAQHCAYYAADATALTPAYFASLDNCQLSQSRILLHPSIHLLDSSFASFSIWQATLQAEDEIPVNYTEPECILVVRPETEVNTYSIGKSLLCFLQQLQRGSQLLTSLEYAVTQAEGSATAFDPGEAISFLINSGAAIRIAPPA